MTNRDDGNDAAMPVVRVGALRPSAVHLAREVLATMRRHRLGTHATALAFRVLVSTVPLALLGIGLLGALGLRSVWDDSIAPALRHHVAASVARAADDTAHRIFARSDAELVVLACALVVWNTLLAVREVEHALDEIHEQEGRRPFWSGLATGVPLALAVDLALVGALLAVVVPPRAIRHGAWHEVVELARWPTAVGLVWLAVALLVRYAPGEHPEPRWASAGSALVVAGWIGATAAFGWWSTSVASYRTAVGTLTAFLALTGYALALGLVFVLGAQLDETLRRRDGDRRRAAPRTRRAS